MLLAYGIISLLPRVVTPLTIPPELRANPVILENVLPGTDGWRLTHPASHHEIEGYASLTSVDQGEDIRLFVNTDAPSYTIEVFRMGWYGGKGARQMMQAIARPGLHQPPPWIDPETDLVECHWQDPYSLHIPDGSGEEAAWVSGIYLAKLTASTGEQSYIIFVVRDDGRRSDYLFQSSVTTYQAYNNWGGKSLYDWNSRHTPAHKVSFNRPYAASPNPVAAYGVGAGEFITNLQPARRATSAGWEYNMVRWLEREGYDVAYATDLDTHARAGLMLGHQAFLIVGHDEYWTQSMRRRVQAARDAGVSLGIFSANTCYWQIRLEPSPLNREPDRTIVAYKEKALTHDPFARDARPENDQRVTTRWRDRPVNLPEAALLGVMYDVDPVQGDVVIAATAPDWALAGTGLKVGDRLPGLLGYEVDRVRRSSPANTVQIAHSPHVRKGHTHYSDMTDYEAASGAIVFATGTIQWSWGLDDFNAPELRPSFLNPAAQQLTRNVLAKLLH